MKMETWNIMSKFTIGENQLSDKKRGYEITKNVRATLSPKLRARGSILSADGAITSRSSSVAASYTCCGRIGTTSLSSFFFFRKSNKAMGSGYFYRALGVSGIKNFIEKLDHFFRPELNGADAYACQPGNDDSDALLDLRTRFLRSE